MAILLLSNFNFVMSIFTVLKRLKSKFKHARKSWYEKTPKGKWEFLYLLGNTLCKLIGIRIFSDMKKYWYSGTVGLLGVSYCILNTYTIQYYIRKNNLDRCLQCSYLLGIAFAVCCPHVQFIK